MPRFSVPWALLLAAGIACADDSEPTFAEKSAAFEQDIARLDAIDPSYPPALQAHLGYATFLIANRGDDCVKRLELAEKHRASVEANVATALLLADGPARLLGMKSEIASGRAFCADNDQAAKDKWLPVARESAVAAIPLYRAIHDYASMAIAQYNMAFADHSLGNTEQANRELQDTLASDERYGLREDAEYNYRKLHDWVSHPVTDVQVAEYLNSFAGRYAHMTFAWQPATGTGIQHVSSDQLLDGRASHREQETHSTFQIVRSGEDLLESSKYESIRASSGDGDENADLDAKVSAALQLAFADSPKTIIGANGQFKGIQDGDAFTDTTVRRLQDVPGQLLPAGDPMLPALKKRLEPALDVIQTKGYVANAVRVGYSIETGMWIGATLMQHRWLQLNMVLPMAGTPNGFLMHTVKFELAGWVPCDPGAERALCVELLIDADPDADAVKKVGEGFAKAGNGDVTYWSNTRIALVVDPDTLRYFGRETRVHAYLAVKKDTKREVQISAQLRDDRSTYR